LPPLVSLDPEKVAWMVTTLVGNALRYIRLGSRHPAGGTITVSTEFDHADSRVTIIVKDTGPGVPAHTVERLFKRDGLNVRGSGLALLLVADVCAAHGGRVDVRSSVGAVDHGTTVRLELETR
jgi:signal transduction histidine kinase